MTKRFSIAAAALVLAATGAAASELPSFEKRGFPVMVHQVQVVGTADVAEQSPTPALDVASPHQRAVMRPRRE
jgi:hypothetical protein